MELFWTVTIVTFLIFFALLALIIMNIVEDVKKENNVYIVTVCYSFFGKHFSRTVMKLKDKGIYRPVAGYNVYYNDLGQDAEGFICKAIDKYELTLEFTK